jgi:hypothetical protein
VVIASSCPVLSCPGLCCAVRSGPAEVEADVEVKVPRVARRLGWQAPAGDDRAGIGIGIGIGIGGRSATSHRRAPASP